MPTTTASITALLRVGPPSESGPVPRHHRPRSGITNDPNREGDEKYILRLIGQVITVSLETNEIIASLPTLGLPENAKIEPTINKTV